MNLAQLYEAYFTAERAWEAELIACFGHGANNRERYTLDGRGALGSALRAAYDEHAIAAAEYFAAYRATLAAPASRRVTLHTKSWSESPAVWLSGMSSDLQALIAAGMAERLPSGWTVPTSAFPVA